MKTLLPQAEAGASGQQIADASVTIWRAVDAALAPVIGLRGSAALYRRSVHLVRQSHPWLAPANGAPAEPGDFETLHAALKQQTGPQAAAAHDAVLQTFHDLLAELIGRTLTQRLLQAAWDAPTTGDTAQDTSP